MAKTYYDRYNDFRINNQIKCLPFIKIPYRNTDILNRKENDLFTIPTDFYGFSKYMIFKRTLMYENVYHLRIFNLFNDNEEPERFIKTCRLAKAENSVVTILEDKYFDFVYEDDFVKIIKYYFDNCENKEKLLKTVNICYDQKYKLSEIANLILNDNSKIIIQSDCSNKNYSGDGSLLKTLHIDFIGLKDSLNIYEKNYS